MLIEGKLITCKRESREFGGKVGKEMLYITLAEADISDVKWMKIKEVFEESGKKFTPDWVKKFEGYVNLKTEFKMPCKDLEGGEHDSIEEFIKTFAWLGASVKVSVTLKDGAIYPNALIFLSEGKSFNPFAEFENDEED